MSKQTAMRCVLGMVYLVAVLTCGGCAAGVTRVAISHSPLPPVEVKRSGIIALQTLVDSRSGERQYIGYLRNGLGMIVGRIGTLDDKPLDGIVTDLLADALRQAGYTVSPVQTDAATKSHDAMMVGGEITSFWLDAFVQVWINMQVHLRLVDAAGRTVWERDIAGTQVNTLWVGATGEYEGTIQQAVDQAVNQAAKEFASEEFYRNVSGAH
jgi:hypothetical protein